MIWQAQVNPKSCHPAVQRTLCTFSFCGERVKVKLCNYVTEWAVADSRALLLHVFGLWVIENVLDFFAQFLLKKVKASHTRYQALGPELIPVYRKSAHRWLQVIHPALGCHYFPPGLWLLYQPQSITILQPVPSYTAWWQRHMGVNNLPKVVTQLCSE